MKKISQNYPQIFLNNSSMILNITCMTNGSFRVTWQSLDLHIGTESIKVVTRDRRTIELSFQEKEIEDIILWQVNYPSVNS